MDTDPRPPHLRHLTLVSATPLAGSTQSGTHQSDLESAFAVWMAQEGLNVGMVAEHRFHPTRRWRLDFYWSASRLAVEVEGLTYDGGRHQRIDGFLRDAEKYEAAMLAGITVYRVPGRWVRQRRPKVAQAIRQMLDGGG